MPTPCWSYARTSTTQQAGADRSGLQRQEQALASWLAQHPDHQLQEALVDPGISAGSGKHRKTGALGAFIRGRQAGTIPPGSVLVVESITRFSREVERQVLGVLLNDFWANDLGLAICGHDEIYTAELIDSQPHRLHVLLALMQQARAEWLERSRRSTGARKAQREKQDAGIRTAGRVPFWILKDQSNKAFRDEAGLFQLDSTNTATVRRMIELHLSGHGGDATARVLNEEQRPTRSRAQLWRGEEVRKILRHPSLKGTLQRSAGNVDNYFPAVVNAAEFERIQQVTASRDLRSNLRGTIGAVGNLFQGLSKCSECGGPISHFMSGSLSAGKRRYVACRVATREQRCSNRGYVPNGGWEAMALALLSSAVWEQLLLRPEDQADTTQLQTEHDAAASRLIELQQQLTLAQERAEQDWLSGSEERLATVERVLAKLRTEISTVESEVSTAAQQLAMVAARPTSTDQAELIRQRLAEFIPQLQEPEHRQSFNRWLKSLTPQVRVLLHPGQRIELIVGENSTGIHAIDESLANLANTIGGGLVPDGRGGGRIEIGPEEDLSLDLSLSEPD